MFIGKMEKEHITLEGNRSHETIGIYGHKAKSLPDGVFMIHTRNDAYDTFDAKLIRYWYEQALLEDIQTGLYDQVKLLLVSVFCGLGFYHLKLFTPEQLMAARQSPFCIDIPDVMIWGRPLTVRILKLTDNAIVTADANGLPLAA